MSESNRRVRFGMAALAIAFRARTGPVSVLDTMNFLATTLRTIPDDVQARCMAVEFYQSVRQDHLRAGAALDANIQIWAAGLPAEVQKHLTDSVAGSVYAWQDRADLR